jgi:hypothetical protein
MYLRQKPMTQPNFVRLRMTAKVVLFVLWCGMLPANDAVFYGQGKQLAPKQESNVQMVAELLHITYGKGLGVEFEIITYFKNHGPDAKLQFGFPINISAMDHELFVEGQLNSAIDPQFRVWEDGREMTTQLANMGDYEADYDLVYLFDVSFAEGESKILRHSYSVGGYSSSVGDWHIMYVLKTGAFWRGNIEKLAITLEVPKDTVHSIQAISPKEHQVSEDNHNVYLHWLYRDVKPDFDFSIGGLPHFFFHEGRDGLLSMLSQPDFYRDDAFYHRYFKNLIFALNGYPFKHPFVSRQYYTPQAPFFNIELQPDPDYTKDKISPQQLQIIRKFSQTRP